MAVVLEQPILVDGKPEASLEHVIKVLSRTLDNFAFHAAVFQGVTLNRFYDGKTRSVTITAGQKVMAKVRVFLLRKRL